jgi:DNA replication protein DnaC/transposase InsO family protein
LSERTGRRIEKASILPSQHDRTRRYRTRQDPFAEVWREELVPMLTAMPSLRATTLLEELQRHHPARYPDRMLRSLQRRVAHWRATEGPERQLIFRQEHPPGLQALSDFTDGTRLGVTLGGEPFPHLLYHFWLAFSGWQYVKAICGGESFTALTEGVQEALWQLGGVPRTHRTDRLSAAYRNLSSRDDEAARYAEFCRHYGMEPTRNNAGVSHENGSVEASHGHVKTGLDEALELRGARDFADLAAYQAFLQEFIARKNARRREEVAIELAALLPLPPRRTTDFSSTTVTVTRSGTISVRNVLYTVPSRLVGCRVKVHIYDDRLVCYLGTTPVLTVARRYFKRNGPPQRVVDYRHLIGALIKKPQAFRHSVFRDELFPSSVFRRAWERLDQRLDPRKACRVYVGLLHLAAMEGCEAVLADHCCRARCRRHTRSRSSARGRGLAGPHRRTRGDDPGAQSRCLRRTAAEADPGRCHVSDVDAAKLPVMLNALRLPTTGRIWQDFGARADREGWGSAHFLAAICDHELAERAARRIARHMAASGLPHGKTFATLDFAAVPTIRKAHVMALAEGDAWIEQGGNLLIFGPSGTGKTHLAAAFGAALVDNGKRVLFTRTTDLVQKLQAARRDLALPGTLAKLDRFDVLILDDLGYVRKDQAETNVLFELIAERYERRSLIATCNQRSASGTRSSPTRP